MMKPGLACAFAVWLLTGCGQPPGSTMEESQAAVASSPPPAPAGDYTDAGLRSRIEQLQADVARQGTDASNLKARAWTLWEWANNYAMAGHPLNPDMTAAMAAIAAIEGEPTDAQAAGRGPVVDMWVNEFTYREQHPDAIGTLHSPNRGPFPVNSYQTLTQIYTVGKAEMGPGSGIVATAYTYGSPMNIQFDDPTGEGYVTAHTSNPDVRLEVRPFEMTGMHSAGSYGARGTPRPFFEVVSGTLREGDTVTVHIGDQRQGSPGFRLPSPSSSALRFRLWVRLDKDGHDFPMHEIGFVTEGLETVGVRGFAPSMVATGETASITVRSEDEFRNRATSGFPEYRVLANGREIARIDPDAAFHRFETRFDTPGVHYLTIESADGKINGEINPVLVEDEPANRILWGETHGHSGYAEGVGTVDAYYEFCRDDAAFDFSTLSEHDIWLDDKEWETLRQAAKDFRQPGVFEPFLGYEWTAAPTLGGHHNVIYRTPDGRRRGDRQRAPRLANLYELLAAEHAPRDVAVIPHAHNPGWWWQTDARVEPLVEIVSNHGTFEWLGRAYLGSGFRLGFIGGSDGHIGHPGLRALNSQVSGSDNQGGQAAVYAPVKSRDAIFDAIKARSTYATNGHRILLTADLNGALPGSEIDDTPRRVLQGRAIGTGPIDRISIIKNGEDVWIEDYTVTSSASGANFVELRLWSESDPAERKRHSRGARTWTGTLQVEGARIVGVSTPNLENVYTESARISADDPSVVEFRIRTRGHFRTIVLELDDLTEDTRFALNATSRDAEPIEATVRAGDMEGGVYEIQQATAARPDTAAIRLIAPPNERERRFEYVDTDGKPGDSYYVRVVTTNGGIAWTSPIWVGGKASPAPGD